MLKTGKRLLAYLLCLAIILPLLPGAADAAGTDSMKKVEAEDTLYADWNGYNKTENNTNASGGVQVGGSDASKNVYYADLKAGVDLSNTAYIKWTVEAPSAGSYDIAMRAHIQIGGSPSGYLSDKVYVTFFVNGETAYKAPFNGKNSWVYDTDVVSVSLKKGDNEIIAIPLVKDIIDANSWGWANADCLYLDDRLTASLKEKEPVMVAVEAEDTLYADWNSYSKLENNSNASGGVQVGGGNASENVAYADLKAGVDLSHTAHVKWVVKAPKAGQYYIGLRYHPYAKKYGNNKVMDPKAYAAFFVNGKDAYQAEFLGNSNWVYDTQKIKVTLNQGDNEIVAIPLVRELLEAYEGGWANVDCLYIQDSLTPVKNCVEAEDTTYAQWNKFSTTENRSDSSGGVIVGGGSHGKNIAYGELKEHADLSNTAYIQWTVEAPADGDYTIGLRYLIKANDLANGKAFAPDAYAAFWINGTAAYQAKFLGKNGWVYDTESISVALKKGLNEIVAIPLVKEMSQNYGSSWANVDCLYLDNRLTVKVPEAPVVLVKAEAEDTVYAQWNKFSTTENRSDSSGGVIVGGGNTDNNLFYSQLVPGADLSGTAYVKWTVNAPADGDYAIALRYLMNAKPLGSGDVLDSGAYAAFFINGQTAYKAKFQGKNNWVYDTETIEVSLKEGENEVIAIPLVQDLLQSYGSGWANVDCLYYDSVLTLEKAPVQVKVEAEDTQYTLWNSFNQVQDHNSASEGKMAAGGSADRNVYFRELVEGVELSGTAWVQWTFDAPEAGNYTFKLRYNPKAKDIAAGKDLSPSGYAAFFVNGKDAYKATFLGKNDWVYDTEEVSIYLNEGINQVVAIPMVKDLYDVWGGGWANVDCLYYDSVLTLQKAPVKITVEAEDRSLTYWNGYNTQEPHNSASGGYQAAGSSAQNNVYYRHLKKGVDLTYTSYVKWVITAPEEGDYTFSLRYAPNADDIKSGKELTPEGYAAFFVNGQDAYKAAFLGYDNWVYNTKEISIHLKQGDNEVIAIPMVKDLYKAWGGGWANVDCLYMEEGLTVKPTGYVEEHFKIAEAEDLTYVQWNLYNTTEKHSSATNKQVAAGSNSAANIYSKDLVPGADLSGTAYLKWTVVAPADGKYTFKLRYAAKEDGVATGDAYENGKAYATFFVNDSDVYTAPLSGFGARCNWLWDTDSVRIQLKKGENELYVIPLVKDQYDAWGGGWANVDCLKMDTRLSLSKAPVYARFEAENSDFNLYEGFATRVGTEDWGSAWENDVTFDNLNEDTILGISHVKYYVNAEKAGTYRIGLGFQQGHNLKEYKAAFFGLSVNMEQKYKVPFTATNAGNNRLVYFDVELKQGDNYIYVTACMKDLMDYPKYPSQKNGYVLWIDHDYILLPEGLTSTVASTRPNWTGDSEADYNQSLLSVWGDLTGTPGKPAGDTAKDTPNGGIWGWVIGLSAAALVVAFLVILLLVKRKKKQEE